MIRRVLTTLLAAVSIIVVGCEAALIFAVWLGL